MERYRVFTGAGLENSLFLTSPTPLELFFSLFSPQYHRIFAKKWLFIRKLTPWRQFLDAIKRDGEETEYRQDGIKDFSVSDLVGIIGTLFLSCFTIVPSLFSANPQVKITLFSKDCVESVTLPFSQTVHDLGLKFGRFLVPIGSTKCLNLTFQLFFVQAKISCTKFHAFLIFQDSKHFLGPIFMQSFMLNETRFGCWRGNLSQSALCLELRISASFVVLQRQRNIHRSVLYVSSRTHFLGHFLCKVLVLIK